MKTKRRRPLTEDQQFTIKWVLACKYRESMDQLDLVNGYSVKHFLTTAAETWDAYRAFAGYPIHRPEPPPQEQVAASIVRMNVA